MEGGGDWCVHCGKSDPAPHNFRKDCDVPEMSGNCCVRQFVDSFGLVVLGFV